jgi:hypothetical protein
VGGWLNRLALALFSQLPNEVDWAFNKLISLSYKNNFYIGYIPQLPQILLDILNSFFSNLTLNTSPNAFETTAGKDVPPMEIITMFNTEKIALQVERVLQCLHIIRNLTFMHENAVAFSKDSQLLHVLAKSMALPSVSIYIEIKHHALDIFENCSRIMPLRGPTDFYLACLKKIVFQNDKDLIVSSLKCLNKLATNEVNEPIIHRIETPFLQRLLQLLLCPDEDIANQALEFLYLFSNAPDSCSRFIVYNCRLISCVRFNVLMLLFKFVKKRKIVIKEPEVKQNGQLNTPSFNSPVITGTYNVSDTPGSQATPLQMHVNHSPSINGTPSVSVTPISLQLNQTMAFNTSNQQNRNIHLSQSRPGPHPLSSNAMSPTMAATPTAMNIDRTPFQTNVGSFSNNGTAATSSPIISTPVQHSSASMQGVVMANVTPKPQPTSIYSLPAHIAVPLPDPRLVSAHPVPIGSRPNIDKRQIDGFHAARW